ncbi:CD2-associated protein isoform X3 [Pungitius pungitius]|uniref:CD2-associated protein isoform X3 n=1 Tax=Pungitius pungitius TaxID=134920 RepID=UPI002E16401B
MEVLVEYDYDALHEDELTLRLGDVIKNVHYIDEDGWMEGDLNGKRGLFPDNFVKEVKKESKEVKETKSEPKEEASQPQRRDKSAGNVANLVQRMSTIGIPTGGFLPQPPAASKKPKRRKCKVLFDYQPQNEDELELKIGDVVDVIEEVEEGWWNGNFNGKSGLFPSNFVKELDATGEDGDTSEGAADETGETGQRSFNSMGEDVFVLNDESGMESAGAPPASPQPAAGNGVIAQPKKIHGVGFGDIFRKGSVKLKARLPSTESEEKKEKPIPSLPSAAKPAHPNMTESQRADGDGKSKAKEYCKVTFAFEGTNEDELTIKEGDVIHILSKKPKKPPPPSKSTAHRAEVPSAEKKPHPTRPEDRVDRPDPKPSKPAAPMVPPKKPVPPPGKGRPGGFVPKRPDKPLAPSPNLKHNGEVPSTRPKSDLEPLVPAKPRTLSGEAGEKSSDTDLISFEEMSSTSEKLSHLTANRPKMPGRRLPAQFGRGPSPTKEVSVEKSLKVDDVDPAAKPKLTETRKPSTNSLSQTPPPIGPDCTSAKAKPSPAAAPSPEGGTRLEADEANAELDELRGQMKKLLLSVELLKAQQTKEIAELRGELDEERLKRVALQVEIDKLKRSVHST